MANKKLALCLVFLLRIRRYTRPCPGEAYPCEAHSQVEVKFGQQCPGRLSEKTLPRVDRERRQQRTVQEEAELKVPVGADRSKVAINESLVPQRHACLAN